MTMLSYNVAGFKTDSYEEAIEVSKKTNKPVEEILEFSYYKDAYDFIKNYKEENN